MSCNEQVMRRAMGADYPAWSDTLRDGTRVRIRPMHADDVGHERDFIEALSPQARRYRFLGQIGEPSAALLDQLTDLDFRQDVAFVATAADDPHGRFIGVARFGTTPDGGSCECAVAVLDAWQGRGLGTLLMTHLVDVARARGIARLYSLDVAENSAMADLAKHLGFTRTADPEDSRMVVHSLRLADGTDPVDDDD